MTARGSGPRGGGDVWAGPNSEAHVAMCETPPVPNRHQEVPVERQGLLRELARVLGRVGDPVAVLHPGGAVVWSNAAFGTLFGPMGASARSAALEGFLTLTGAADFGAVLRWVAEQREPWSGRGACLHGPQGPRGVDVDVSPISLGDETAWLVAVLRPEGSAPDLGDQLLQADRLAAMGQLAAGVAHGINNPLSYLLANLTFLGRELDRLRSALTPAQVAELNGLIADANEGATRIRDIVRDLKSFTRADRKEGPLDVRQVADVAIKMAENEIRYRARLVRDYADVGSVWGDGARLEQVLLNLLVNAAQAMPVGSVSENEIRVGIHTSPEGLVLVEVHDTGEGIPAENLDRIFEPFFTTRDCSEGTGLGLSIGRHVVAEMGGTIHIESEPGAGTSVTVTLPPWLGSVDTPAKETAMDLPERRARILVVDDEALVGRALQRILSPHLVDVCQSGRDAVARLLSEPFDAVICDLMMPEMSGMAVYREVTAARPDLARKFAFATGGAFTREAREFLDAIPNPTIEKPFRMEEIERVIDDLLAK